MAISENVRKNENGGWGNKWKKRKRDFERTLLTRWSTKQDSPMALALKPFAVSIYTPKNQGIRGHEIKQQAYI